MNRRHPTPVAACGRNFPEELISGYLDHALTHAEDQRVRIHLEDCAACRAVLAELTALRETAMSTEFVIPADDQWDERPRGRLSWSLRGGGWLVLVAWLVAIGGYAAWQIAVGPESLVGKLMIFGGVSGGALLFFSVLVDRLRAMPGDRYRRVEK